MTRRNLVTLASRALAATGAQDFFADWLQAAEKTSHAHPGSPPPEPDRWTHYKPAFFSPAEFNMLESFTQILIPADDTPGAREAHVAHFTDFVVNAAAEYAPETQRAWRSAMQWLTAQNFANLTPNDKLALVERMAAPELDRSIKHDGFPVYKLVKQMTVFAYYTSRLGLVGNLQYQGIAYLTEFPACNHAEHRKV